MGPVGRQGHGASPVTCTKADPGIEDRRQNRPPGSRATAAGRSHELSGDHDARRTRVIAPPRGGAQCAQDCARIGRRSEDGRSLFGRGAPTGSGSEWRQRRGSHDGGPARAGAAFGAAGAGFGSRDFWERCFRVQPERERCWSRDETSSPKISAMMWAREMLALGHPAS
jgi:hypothetical protein